MNVSTGIGIIKSKFRLVKRLVNEHEVFWKSTE